MNIQIVYRLLSRAVLISAGLGLVIGQALAATDTHLKSAGAIEFGPDNVLFVGDSKASMVHAFKMRPIDNPVQSAGNYGSARTFEGITLIEGIDHKIAGAIGTTPEQVVINDMRVHPLTKQMFLSVERGRSPNALAMILRIDNLGALDILDISALEHSSFEIPNTPVEETLEFNIPQRTLAITDMTYYKGELLIAGVSNEEFASTLRRVPYPFSGDVTSTTIEIWHAVHAQFETRAPIITQMVKEIAGEPHLIAVYACTPLVRIPLADLEDGAHIRGEMIGELGFGNTPVDMISYTDGMDGNNYVLVTHSARNATRVLLDDIGSVKPMPVNVANNFGPSGINQYSMPLTAVRQLDLIDEQWAVVIRHNPNDSTRLDLHTLPLPFFFDRADHIVEMNWPGSPDPFGYRQVTESE